MQTKIANEELETFVGKKADYYLEQWAGIESGQPVSRMNVPALLLSLFWLFYRKMYFIGILFFLAAVAVATISDFIFIHLLGYASIPKMYNEATTMLFPVICAAFANKWYLLHAKKKIEKIKQSILSKTLQLTTIKKEGGTSIISGIFAPVLLFLIALIISAIIEMVKKGKI